MKFGVFVVRDNASGQSSLPFFAATSAIAKRQLASQLREIPPSIRSDFELLAVGTYDDEEFDLSSDMSYSSVATGSDDDMIRMLDQDAAWFRRHARIDQAPVNQEVK